MNRFNMIFIINFLQTKFVIQSLTFYNCFKVSKVSLRKNIV